MGGGWMLGVYGAEGPRPRCCETRGFFDGLARCSKLKIFIGLLCGFPSYTSTTRTIQIFNFSIQNHHTLNFHIKIFQCLKIYISNHQFYNNQISLLQLNRRLYT